MTTILRVTSVLLLCFSSTLETEGFIELSSSNSIYPKIERFSVHHHHRIDNHKQKFAFGFRQCQKGRSIDSTLFASNGDNDENEATRKDDASTGRIEAIKTTSVPFASYFLLFVTVRSTRQLLTLPTEIPGAFLFGSGQNIDYLGTAFDIFFVVFGIQQLLQQNGIGGEDKFLASDTMSKKIAGTESRITLDVGREPGTMMEKEWAASGARLLLPVNLTFSPNPVKIDFPGEESLNGRFAYKLEVLDEKITFVGPSGEVKVDVEDGAWVALPITEPGADTSGGAFKIRFFLDFPSGAKRNDVTLPEGRIFFSGVGFSDIGGVTEMLAGISDRGVASKSVITVGNDGSGLLREGRLTYKRNGPLNLWGSFGDTNAFLGKYRVDNAKARDE